MSQAGSTGRVGFRHEAMLYASEEEFLAVAVPFLADGLAAGEPTFLGIPGPLQLRVREELGDPGDLILLVGDEHYAQPFTTLQRNHAMFTDCLQHGGGLRTGRIRMVGVVPQAGGGAQWEGWVRYEAAVNDLYAALPLWSMCPYDTRTTPVNVLSDVELTHPYLTTARTGHQLNPRYSEPTAVLAERARKEFDPLERSRPDLELSDPTPAEGRRAVATLAATTTLDQGSIDGLVIGVSEVLANAALHGRPPVELHVWVAPDRAVVRVRDRGSGPSDPYAGYLPLRGTGNDSGLGLWITHQMCSRVTLTQDPDGFSVRLVAGTPHPTGPVDG